MYHKRYQIFSQSYFLFLRRKAHLTMQMRHSSDYKKWSFIVPIFSNIPKALKTCGHELMHLYFHNNDWEKIKSEIGKEKNR